MDKLALMREVRQISRDAGQEILAYYGKKGALDVKTKADNSPLTQADMASHHCIIAGLSALTPEYPVLSEESVAVSWEERQGWQTYWLVDPLDGTKEFIGGNGEFTVNIALIENGKPVLGVVYVPVLEVLYFGLSGAGAGKQQNKGPDIPITTNTLEQGSTLRVVASRRHGGDTLAAWLEKAGEMFPRVELVNMGSSLKICLVAEGQADIYPRLAPTSEWDTAAAQAVLEAAGGILTDTDFRQFRYNRKASILNPHFFAIGDRHFSWPAI